MRPVELTSASFAGYPPLGAALCRSKLEILQSLPMVLAPILLRDLSGYDWKFPAERDALQAQLLYLGAAPSTQRTSLLQGFAAFSPGPELTGMDWVNNPSGFMEKLTAWLWSTHAMDRFRAQADAYGAALNAAVPEPMPKQPRLGIVVIGTGHAPPDRPLFRKLRPHGVHFTRIKADEGMEIILAAGSRRAAAAGAGSGQGRGFRNWYIDGGPPVPSPALTTVSYADLEKPRALLLERIQRAIATGTMGPEELRSLLARMKPADIGLPDVGGEHDVLGHFAMSLLTEGAGTQIFATTFVQWAARECIRRAQPETLIVRYTPRQQAQSMNAMLTGETESGPDLAGSLVDADMGAYYTWLSLRRLSASADMRFLVWLEGQGQAIAIGPGLPGGTSSDSAMTIAKVLELLT